ncbi:MAG: hydrogenase expression/formation protein HypE, partial [Synechococcaceae bacterium WB9_2_170]|nr:hydrogenase expression/formation protein HypE [Synechococcaceae bacterium WB9_2_170]
MGPEPEPTIQLGHGGGGRLSQQLLHGLLLPGLGVSANGLHDAALLPLGGQPGQPSLAYTTDSYVVRPLCFPGGDIGRLAVIGTVNDLAMAGATPLALSLGLILEEGLPIATLQTVVNSIQEAAAACGVAVVTGDTKVVERGKGDGLYINTSGV